MNLIKRNLIQQALLDNVTISKLLSDFSICLSFKETEFKIESETSTRSMYSDKSDRDKPNV